MLTEPMFYAVALPAVCLYGLSKGGFAGVSLLAVPLMSLVISPVQAAAVLLPVLVVQDAVTVYAYRKSWDATTLKVLLPGALLGIGLGTLTAAFVTPDAIRLAVGLLAIAFCLNAWFGRQAAALEVQPHAIVPATVLGTLAGYSSFVIHAGGVPFNMYTLPRSASREVFVATGGVFFALVNVIKIPPFFGLGQFSIANLILSATLLPVAIAANLAGIWLVRRLPTALFYKVIYGLTFLVGLKLASDGGSALFLPPK